MIVHIPHLNISYNFFIAIIAKHNALHRPSIQIPPIIAAFLLFNIISDKVHYSPDIIQLQATRMKMTCGTFYTMDSGSDYFVLSHELFKLL